VLSTAREEGGVASWNQELSLGINIKVTVEVKLTIWIEYVITIHMFSNIKIFKTSLL
jgi:hypothetical protein